MLTHFNTMVMMFYGIIALLFMCWAFFFAPDHLPRWKWQIVGFVCASFVSAFGAVSTGEMALQLDPELDLLKGLGIQATGGAAFFCLAIIVWLRYAKPTTSDTPRNLIEGRSNITDTSKLLMRQAEFSISIFGGDGSWINSHADLITHKVAENVDIRMLCLFNEQSKSNFLKAKDLGISITPYPSAIDLKPLSGQIIDDQTLFFVNKRPKRIEDSIYSGAEGSDAAYHYTASTIDAERNPQLFSLFRDLFNFLHQNVQGQALRSDNNQQILIERSSIDSLTKSLKNVPAYSNADIKHETLQIEEMKPLRLYIDVERIYSSWMMDKRLSACSFDLGECISVESPSGARAVFPPIIERHNGSLYIIDGIHRLYYSLLRGRKSERCILIENVSTPLPAIPTSWSEMDIRIGLDHPRTGRYNGLKMENWRQLDAAGVTQKIYEIY